MTYVSSLTFAEIEPASDHKKKLIATLWTKVVNMPPNTKVIIKICTKFIFKMCTGNLNSLLELYWEVQNFDLCTAVQAQFVLQDSGLCTAEKLTVDSKCMYKS